MTAKRPYIPMGLCIESVCFYIQPTKCASMIIGLYKELNCVNICAYFYEYVCAYFFAFILLMFERMFVRIVCVGLYV